MTTQEAIQVLVGLLAADADCRCGNFTMDEERQEAVKTALTVMEDANKGN